jgi:hypothetical protein
LTEHVFDVSKDGGVMNRTVEATDNPEQTAKLAAEQTPARQSQELTDLQATDSASNLANDAATTGSTTGSSSTESASESAQLKSSALPASATGSPEENTSDSSAAQDTQNSHDMGISARNAEQSSPITPPPGAEIQSATLASGPRPSDANGDSLAMAAPDLSNKDVEGIKKQRASRTPKAPAKPVEAAGSIITIVERVVRMTALSEEHGAALARLFNVSLPDDYVARLTRLTGASLGPIGSGAAEALTIVLGLESANPIHVGVQLGRLAATSLPDVYRCAHALTGEIAPALPKGDNAVFAVADVLATLTADDFALARALSSALE